jgi:hypothetical protein
MARSQVLLRRKGSCALYRTPGQREHPLEFTSRSHGHFHSLPVLQQLPESQGLGQWKPLVFYKFSSSSQSNQIIAHPLRACHGASAAQQAFVESIFLSRYQILTVFQQSLYEAVSPAGHIIFVTRLGVDRAVYETTATTYALFDLTADGFDFL